MRLLYLVVPLLIVSQLGCSTPAPQPVHVSQLGWPTPIGFLGKPLGTKVTIKAARPATPVLITNAIAISAVDGQALPQPVVLELRGFKEIGEGDVYEIEGYETGEFSGPMGEGAQQAWGYRPLFVVSGRIKLVPKQP